VFQQSSIKYKSTIDNNISLTTFTHIIEFPKLNIC